jgi:hypothetical protein
MEEGYRGGLQVKVASFCDPVLASISKAIIF